MTAQLIFREKTENSATPDCTRDDFSQRLPKSTGDRCNFGRFLEMAREDSGAVCLPVAGVRGCGAGPL